jgi:hypothetical protein
MQKNQNNLEINIWTIIPKNKLKLALAYIQNQKFL